LFIYYLHNKKNHGKDIKKYIPKVFVLIDENNFTNFINKLDKKMSSTD